MVNTLPAPADRREFLRTCGRWSALVALAGGVAGLARQGRLQPLNAACLDPRPCARCAGFRGCDFPAALATRTRDGGHAS